MKKQLSIFVILLVSFSAHTALADIFVNNQGTGDYPTIQDALDVAPDGEVILLYPGHYQGEGNRNLEFRSNVTLRPSLSYGTCRIDCEGSPENPAGGFNLVDETGGTIERITVTNAWLENGAAITTGWGSYTFLECQFEENYANQNGGVLKAEDGSNVVFENCIFYRNQAGSHGGALWGTANANLSVRYCTFVSNGAGSGASFYLDGGASLDVQNTLVAWGTGGSAFDSYYPGEVSFYCTDIYGHPQGDWTNGASGLGSQGNICEDPLLINPMANPVELNLSWNSPCAEAASSCGRMGALPRLDTTEVHYGMNAEGTGMFTSIRDGVEYLPDGATLWLEDGAYLGEGNSGISPVGKSINIRSLSDNWAYCRIFLDNTSGDVFVFDNDGTQTEVWGIHIAFSGLETGVVVAMSGDQEVTFRNCIFSQLGGSGGNHLMTFAGDGALNLINCEIRDQNPPGTQGVLRITGATSAESNVLLIRDCLFYRNTINGAALLEMHQFNLQLENSEFRSNFSDSGAGILATGSDVQIRDCEFVGNFLAKSPVWLEGCTGLLESCDFYWNEIEDHAGGLTLMMSDLDVFDCRFKKNKTQGSGGGVFISANDPEDIVKTVNFDHCEFQINESGLAGSALFAAASGSSFHGGPYQDLYVNLDNCTFHANKITTETAYEWDSQIYGTEARMFAHGNLDLRLNYCLITSGVRCKAVTEENYASITVQCSNIKGNEYGDWVDSIADQFDDEGNLSVFPYYCASAEGNLWLNSISECLPENNICGAMMGAFGEGCSGLTDAQESVAIVAVSRISGNAPNPFNPSTEISYELARDSVVSLHIYNIHGQRIRSLLLNEQQGAGQQQVRWNGQDGGQQAVAAGVYFARLETGGQVSTHKMILIK